MRWWLTAMAVAVVVCAPARVSSEETVSEEEAEQLTLSCGEIKNSLYAFQVGTHLWIEYNAQTRRPVNGLCPFLSVGVEAWISGVSGSAYSDWDLFTATASRQIPVSAGSWLVKSKHYRAWLSYFVFSNGEESTQVVVSSDDPMQVTNDPSNPNIVSPILVDAGRDGYRLTSARDGVLFDIDADGRLDRVAWTDPDGDDEFLAMDRNGNGRIDDGSELFGNHTVVYPGSDVTSANGFEALGFMEGPSFGRSVIDGVIDARDAVFPRLVLWRDANHNGISEAGELRALRDSGAIAIETTYKTSGRRDRYGNEFRQRARVLWEDGEFYVYDVWLRRQ